LKGTHLLSFKNVNINIETFIIENFELANTLLTLHK
jgi:hypothetical protein